MRIQDIERYLEQSKNDAIEAVGVDGDVARDIALAAPPQPEMGDRGFPCFALAPVLKTSPQEIAEDVADRLRDLVADDDLIADVSTAGPYVNLSFDKARLSSIVVGQALQQGDRFGHGSAQMTVDSDDDALPESISGTHWMVEFSAPNTNKPQHLGHVRNNLLGDTVSGVLDFAGNTVTRVNLINDRGIHICKSMLAYELFGDGETPESTGKKGDHFVGDYYVLFNQKFGAEYDEWQETDAATTTFQNWLDSPDSADARDEFGDDESALREAFFADYENDYFNDESDLGRQARQMLNRWEDGDDEVVELWNRMNRWVIEGFDETYDSLDVEFDRVYFESDTYQKGREIVDEGLESGLFETDYDGAVICNLEKVGLEGKKVLLRADGTTVYMTQDLGTAVLRFEEYEPDRMVYVVGDEQEYHFDVLFRILAELRPELEGRLHHLSYGMVELPEGKMKSREGKVVDADDLLDEMQQLADSAVDERYSDLDDDKRKERAEAIGLAALKYYILDFAPRTTVQFDPERSIDFQGRTGPYCLYGYARIESLKRRIGGWPELDDSGRQQALESLGTQREMEVIRTLQRWPAAIDGACDQLNPGRITEFLFELCSAFSSLYNDDDHRIVDIDGPRRDGLLLLANAVQHNLAAGLGILGIPTLEEM